jgi:hypothetical protein
MGFNVNSRNFDDRATRGVGPGAYYNPNLSYWGYVNSDERKAVNASTFFNIGSDRRGHPLEGDQSRRDDAPDVVPVDQHRHRLEPQRAGLAVGGKRRGRPLRPSAGSTRPPCP